ncbi:MAG: RNA pseudouridine synthase [Bacteroidales bacterium]|nr:RNA pseudouridine synthase [Bacteroidales bacterium]
MTPLNARILFEDNHLIVVNKLPSEIVQGDKTGDKCLLDAVKEYIQQSTGKPGNVFAGLVHRIDRPVSGAVIFARTSKALSRMTAMMKSRDFSKTYLALVKTLPAELQAELAHFLAKNEKQNKSYVCSETVAGAKLARLSYRHRASSTSFHLIEIDLLTGRHHQIRAQMAAVGCPIAGDLKYGADRSNSDGSICLHAWKLAFEHPVRKTTVEIIAPLPDKMPWNLFVV